MKQEKGEAAFESVDDVLAEAIVTNTREHGAHKTDEPAPAPAENAAASSAPAAQQWTAKHWIIATVLAGLVVALACLFFGKCRKRFR